MNAKEYLSQIRYIDRLVDSKLEQLDRWKSIATKATATLSDMPRSDSSDLQSLETTVLKIVDMEREINADIDRLVDFKREANAVMERVDCPQYRMLLEFRYFCGYTWNEIAAFLQCDLRSIYRAHYRALREVDEIRKNFFA